MHAFLKSALAVGVAFAATQALAQVTFYESEGFEGRSFTTQRQVADFQRIGFNDRASSAVVLRDRWEVCQDAGFGGRCIVLRAGRYPSLAAMGMNDRVSSVRTVGMRARVEDARYAPTPEPVYDNHRRAGERMYQATVTSVHAVVGASEQRCWIEHQTVSQDRGGANVPGALVGAVLGGVIGHQIGGGTGRDIATVGGAVAGAAVGSRAGRDNQPQQARTRDVQRCADVPAAQARPAYWDVGYEFRGRAHQVQMTTRPGATITVNRQGEPRA